MLSPELARYTGYLVRRAQQLHAALWQQELLTESTSVQFGVLSLLASNPGIDQRSLGALLQLDRSTVADVVLRMERRGLIARVRDEGDRRRNILSLTEQGSEELATLLPHAERVNEALVGGLDERDRAELNRLLGILLDTQTARSLSAG
ncbi:DNA-binding MarR family transcriptional regulator [Homoserinimonas aerilata]|uniref:DNA-binding MarR family transcriptional regulator n=1 Tax=Homoserinimonas aerilata TaxID=1162970 RepID=A0A542YFW0_9MICO|nr:MarR family winged helix-turn-helix transcriptional regulator [Homoserinimonas aerilata]TQL46976.1 DNA-binding MarR family transcriptional regulator [Homoserinimonas aerilata]